MNIAQATKSLIFIALFSFFLILTTSFFIKGALANPLQNLSRCSELSGTFKPNTTKCYTVINVNLQVREEFEKRALEKTFSSATIPGFIAIDSYVDEKSRTGNADITVGFVDSDSKVVSVNEVKKQEKSLFDFLSELEQKTVVEGVPVENLQRLKMRAQSDFETYSNAASQFSNSKAGVNVSAYAQAVCNVKNKILGGCAIWGPGGNMHADVYIIMMYVGNPNDVATLKNKYIEEAKALNLADPSLAQPKSTSNCVSINSKNSWQNFNLNGSFTRIINISGGWSVDARSYSPVGASGHSGQDADALAPYNQYKFDQRFPFGALLMINSSQEILLVKEPMSFPSPLSSISMRINDADNALGDNAGSLQVCFGK